MVGIILTAIGAPKPGEPELVYHQMGGRIAMVVLGPVMLLTAFIMATNSLCDNCCYDDDPNQNLKDLYGDYTQEQLLEEYRAMQQARTRGLQADPKISRVYEICRPHFQ